MDETKLNRFDGSEINWNQQYAVIGQFIVEYEKICERLRFNCSAFMQLRGLKDWPLSEIIFHQNIFTLNPLFSCYRSMSMFLLKGQPDIEDGFKSLAGDMQKIMEIRNRLAHGTYIMGEDIVQITDSETPNEFAFIKKTPKADGTFEYYPINKISDVKLMIDQVRTVYKKLNELHSRMVVYLFNNGKTVGFQSTTG